MIAVRFAIGLAAFIMSVVFGVMMIEGLRTHETALVLACIPWLALAGASGIILGGVVEDVL